MKASYNWLRVLIPQLTATPEQVARLLTGAGLEVEAITRYGEAAEQCIVAKVTEVQPHPERSSLRLVTVDIGGQSQTVVCGAPNVPGPGGLVVLAPLGAKLPPKGGEGEPLVLTPRKIGGVVSEGMLCSEAELGLTSEGDGILVLAEGSASPGAPLTAVLPEATDTIFEIGLTPNRSDALGHIGVARELAALLGVAWRRPAPSFPETGDADAAETRGATVELRAADRCSSFATAVVTEVKVGDSPPWLRYRLASLGVRSISNVVGITRLVMLEWGHPMHAYDLGALTPLPSQGALPTHSRLCVRLAEEGEVLRTLDGQDRKLTGDDLVIADGKGAVGLAGVMGGGESEVTGATEQLLLECAVFEPRGVRRTARRNGLHTEASHRFERGVDASDSELVLASAASHLVRLAGAKLAKGVVHTGAGVRFPISIRLRQTRLDAILGTNIPWREALTVLERLGLKLGHEEAGAVEVEVPAHRHDLQREIDLIEEVARVYGMDRIPAKLPRVAPTRDVGEQEAFATTVREAAVSLGLSEVLLMSLCSAKDMTRAHAPEPSVLLKNPLTREGAGLLTSVVPGLLATAARAARREVHDLRLFALQTVFTKAGDGELPSERLVFAGLCAGARPGWLEKPSAYDVWDAKGLCEGLLRRLGAEPEATAASADPLFHPRALGALSLDGEALASFGLVHPDVLDAYELTGPVVLWTVEVERLKRRARRAPTFAALPRFPASVRDLAIVVREGLAAGEVKRVLVNQAGALAESVQLFDRYAGAGVPEGHVSLAFRIVYRKPDTTLTDAEVDAQHQKVVAEVQSRFAASLRA